MSAMGGRTTRPQVPLYLDPEKVELLNRLAEKTGRTKQELLREAVDEMFVRDRMMRAPKRPK